MKQSTKDYLISELGTGNYQYSVEGNRTRLNDLYRKYLEAESDSVDRFVSLNVIETGHCEDYKDFMLQNTNLFNISDDIVEIRKHKYPDKQAIDTITAESILEKDIISSIHNYRIYLWNLEWARDFVSIVNGVVESEHILDVGSGNKIPLSSLLLTKYYDKVSSMDSFSRFWKDISVFKKLGVDVIDEYFTIDTDITPYDAIVGSAPCGAIKPIVESCAETDDKEYMIFMCDCCSPRNGLTGFVEYLRDKDSRLSAFSVRRQDEKGKKKEVVRVQDEELREWWDEVYITNSTKHQDDIMGTLHNVRVIEEKELDC